MKGEKNPKVLLASFRSGELDTESFSEVLISIIEGSDETKVRVESLEMLNELDLRDSKIMKLLQSLLISDSAESLRSVAAKKLIEAFLSQSHSEIRWALENESSIGCLSGMIEGLRVKDEELLGRFLREILKDIIDRGAPIEFGIRRQYNINLRILFERKNIEEFSVGELVEIYMNYRTVLGLEDKYDLDAHYCHHMIEKGLVDSLDLGGIKINNISEIPGLEYLSRLEGLDLTQTNLTEITGLSNIMELRYLNLSWNKLTEIKGLDSLKNLMSINLEDNNITEINDLQNLTDLKELWLQNNKISKITGLENLRNLEYLYLDGNNITKLSGLNDLKNLITLSLVNNKISKIKKLKNLEKLKNLDLSRNKLKKINGLLKLRSLEYLEIEDNYLVGVRKLKKLKKLRSVSLYGNDIPKKKLRKFEKWLEKEVKKRDLKLFKMENLKSS